jgi:hypothetical protein
MNNFIFDEIAAEQYRNDRLAEAKANNSLVRSEASNLTLKIYRALESLGVLLENWGVKIQARYNCLARSKKSELLTDSAK